MIRIQGRLVVYGEVWLDEEPPARADVSGVDVLVFHHRPAPTPDAWPSPTGRPPERPLHSLQSALDGPPEKILARFDETCRRHVRRAERQDGLEYEVLVDPAAGLEEFAEFYDAFARQKSLWPADRHWLERTAEAGQLTLSHATCGGERLVWHAHLSAGRTVRLAHSASLYRGTSEEHRSLVARANRWLHFKDMLSFRAAGFACYDWGGVFMPESTAEEAGINRFKRSFGGRPVLAYDCAVPATLRGRVWLMVRSALRRGAPQRPVPAAPSEPEEPTVYETLQGLEADAAATAKPLPGHASSQ